MPNLNELIDLREWARDQDKLRKAGLLSEWDQSVWLRKEWTCSTACCIAGKVVLNAGAQPIWDDGNAVSVEFNGGEELVRLLARDLLDITSSQADALFEASNTFPVVEHIIDAIIADPQWDWELDTELENMRRWRES